MPKTPPRFRYRPRDPETLLRRIRTYQFNDTFNKAVREAVKGMPKRLCELLRFDEIQPSREHLAVLADLIEWRFQTRGRGRPRGSILMSHRQELEHQITYRARKKLMRLRQARDTKRLPAGMVDQVIEEAANQLAGAYDGEVNDVSLKNIRNAVKRGTKRKRVSP